jgi:hypothetical protein
LKWCSILLSIIIQKTVPVVFEVFSVNYSAPFRMMYHTLTAVIMAK